MGSVIGVLYCFGRTSICYATIGCVGGLENESAFAGLLRLQTLGPRLCVCVRQGNASYVPIFFHPPTDVNSPRNTTVKWNVGSGAILETFECVMLHKNLRYGQD